MNPFIEGIVSPVTTHVGRIASGDTAKVEQ
jgi:hypothetical protein